MRKVLLISFIIFCIFQMMVMATAIDIGSVAIDGNDYWLTGTWINGANPANETGTITTVKIYAQTGYPLAGCKVATFYLEAGTNFSTRDYETVNNGNGAGVVVAGSEQTFTVDLDVVAGDYIGIYFSSGRIESTTSGTSWRTQAADNIPSDNVEYTAIANVTLSLYGTGATPPVGITWNTKTISKWNNVTISKWNGM